MRLLFFKILFLLFATQIILSQEQEVDPNGYNIFYYPNGNKSSEGYLVDGKPDGYWKNYYEDGSLRSEGNRRFFMLDSIWNFYYPDGNLKKSIYYREDKRNGYTIKYDYYYDNDSVKHYHKKYKALYLNGRRNGKTFYYDRDSDLQFSFNYRSDKRHGLGKEYNKDGLVIRLFDYYESYLIRREAVNRYDNNDKKTGKWVSFHPNGNVSIEKHYEEGVLNGTFIEYSLSGDIVKQKTYVNGEIYVPEINDEKEIQLLAEIIEKHDDKGNLKFQGAYIDDVPVGIHRYFDSQGKLKKIKEHDRNGNITGKGLYDNNGLKTGEWKLFDTLHNYAYAKGKYKNGKREGVWIFYFPNKEIEQKGRYSKGKQEGEWIWYYQNRQERKIENFFNGKLEGEYVEFDQNGNIILKGKYFDGVRQGEWYYNVGNITKKGTYEAGNKHGYWKHYFNDTGDISYEGNFVNGVPDGTHRYYYNSKGLKLIANYRMGSKHNNWRRFNTDGSIFITQTYENDRLVRVDGRRINIDY